MKLNRNKILILGGVTHENRGDLAMIKGLISQLERDHPNLVPILFSHNPELSRIKFSISCLTSPDVELTAGWSQRTPRITAIFSIIRFLSLFIIFRYFSARLAGAFGNSATLSYFTYLREARAVVVHGSGSFNTLWWYDWIYPKTACCISAYFAGVPVLMTSQGIGPIGNPIDKFVARLFFQLASFLGVRDGNYTEPLLTSLGADVEKIAHTGDDALLLQLPPDDQIESTLHHLGIPRSKLLIGVNFRNASAYHPQFEGTASQLFADTLDAILNELDAHIVFIPISYDSYDDDRESARSIADLMQSKNYSIIRDELPAEMLWGLTKQMTVCLGTSYHFLLFSLSSCVVSIGLYNNAYYEQKLNGLFSAFGLRTNCLDVRGKTANFLRARVLDALFERDGTLEFRKSRKTELDFLSHESRARLNFLIRTEPS